MKIDSTDLKIAGAGILATFLAQKGLSSASRQFTQKGLEVTRLCEEMDNIIRQHGEAAASLDWHKRLRTERSTNMARQLPRMGIKPEELPDYVRILRQRAKWVNQLMVIFAPDPASLKAALFDRWVRNPAIYIQNMVKLERITAAGIAQYDAQVTEATAQAAVRRMSIHQAETEVMNLLGKIATRKKLRNAALGLTLGALALKKGYEYWTEERKPVLKKSNPKRSNASIS